MNAELAVPPDGWAPLVVAVVAPIGTKQGPALNTLSACLRQADYEVADIQVTELVEGGVQPHERAGLPVGDRIRRDRAACARFRERTGRKDAVAAVAIREIERREAALRPDRRRARRAYVLRSVKRPEEVDLFRWVYGDGFVLVGLIQERDAQRAHLSLQMGSKLHEPSQAVEEEAKWLLRGDQGTPDEPYGPDVQQAFHRADVFVRAQNNDDRVAGVERFVRVMLGDVLETPTADEVAMSLAETYGFRSGFLQRQVGAAIVDGRTGSVLALGTNDVPRAGGGLYWCDDPDDARDNAPSRGFDGSFSKKIKLLEDAFGKLVAAGWITPDKLRELGLDADVEPEELASRIVVDGNVLRDTPLTTSRIMDTLEFHRAVHAEMTAITDAARRGVAIQDGVLYTTTFPCHICAKHIIAAGISRVVYIEPYPRSHADSLHGDAVELRLPGHTEPAGEPRRVPFEPYLGIAPRRYRQFFSVAPGARRGAGADAVGRDRWKAGRPRWEEPFAEPAATASTVSGRAARATGFLGPVDLRDPAPAVTP